MLEGQLCYSLDLSEISTEETKAGLENGLMLVLDPGASTYGMTSVEKGKEDVARIYLNTLASFTDSREGSYSMSSLKRMTGTDSFMKLSDEVKNCQTESFEDCSQKRFIKTVQDQCDCIPWALSSALQQKVRHNNISL